MTALQQLKKRASELRDEVEALEADLRESRAHAANYRRGLQIVRGLLRADMSRTQVVTAWNAVTDALGEDPIDELIKERDGYV